MAFERITDNIQRLKNAIQDFVDSSAEYYKLELFNKGIKGVSAGIKILLIAFFILFFILFISIGASVWISTALETPSVGFFIVGVFYLLLFLFILLFGGKIIKNLLVMKFSKIYFKKFEIDSEPKKPMGENEKL